MLYLLPFRLVYKALECVVEETRKTVGENVRLPDEDGENDEEDMGQLFSLSENNMIKQLTLATIKRLSEQHKVSDNERADKQ